MEVRACYEEMGSNFDEVLSRLGSEQMVQRFAIKFLNDKSYETLEAALKEKDVDSAFRAAHTLKGVCVNLGFDKLYEVSSALTEKLRAKELDGTDVMFEKVKEQYDITVNAIRKLLSIFHILPIQYKNGSMSGEQEEIIK